MKDYSKKLFEEGKLPEMKYKQINFNKSRVPVFYGAPKVHKAGVPLRPIVSSYSSPTQTLSRYIHDLIKPIIGKTTFSVKNSTHFVENIKTFKLRRGDAMVSYDATSLFTNVPIKETLLYTREILNKDDTLKNRTNLSVDDIITGMELCMRCTYFKWRNTYYEQED